MRWLLLIAVCWSTLLFTVGCTSTSGGRQYQVERVYLRQDDGPERELAIRDLDNQPRAREKATISFQLPDYEIPEMAVRYGPSVASGDLVAADVDGVELSVKKRTLLLVLIPPGHAGGKVRLTFSGPRGHRIKQIQVGPADVLERASLAELPELIVGVGLAFIGCVLLAAGAVLHATKRSLAGRASFAHLGLFVLPVGLVCAGQSQGVRGALIDSAQAWTWLFAFGPYLNPTGLLLFVDGLFPSATSKMMRRFAYVFPALLALALALDGLGLVTMEVSKRLPSALTPIVVAVLCLRLARNARASAPARTILIGLSVMGVSLTPDFLFAATGGAVRFSLGQTTHWALLAFTTALMVSMAQVWIARTEALLQSEERLAVQVETLVQRGKELDALNVELSHQVADRARAMARAATIGTAPRGRDFAIGDVVDGRYRIDAVLGQGGMGVVFAVSRLTDGGALALKVMRGRVDATQAQRFIREAEIAARLRHDNLVAVLDVGVTAAGVPFLVMARVSGGSLEDVRADFGDWRLAVSRLAQIAEGLAHLHKAKIVHRDLKPANVLVEQTNGQERLRISDFGIAKDSSDEPLGTADTQVGAPPLTAAQMLLGTPAYMAPEAVDAPRAANAAWDMFALGVVAYELAFGRYPFEVPPMLSALAGRRQSLPTTPTSSAPVELVRLVLACLEDEPSLRPTAREFADTVTALRDHPPSTNEGAPPDNDETAADLLRIFQPKD